MGESHGPEQEHVKQVATPSPPEPGRLDWGREVCGVLPVAESREWLCTNGIGGFGAVWFPTRFCSTTLPGASLS